MIIGVSDHKREIIGVKDPLLLEEKIPNMVFDGIQPFVSPFISVMNVEGKPVLIVKVLPGVDRPYYKKSEGVFPLQQIRSSISLSPQPYPH